MNSSLATRYLGLGLSSPLVVGASPVGDDLSALRRLEDLGAGAVVLHSLFEEQYLREQEAALAHTEPYADGSAEASGFFPAAHDYTHRPDAYFDHLRAAKAALSIPVIASLNGLTTGGWLDYAIDLQSAGADAVELNAYRVPSDDRRSGASIEEDLVDLVRAVRARLRIPFAVKLSPFYTSLPHLVRQVAEAGADGVVLFNRFYQPDLDIENLEVQTRVQLSTPSDLLLRLRWMALLHGRYPLSLALSGGVHKGEDVVKALMAGADVVQVASYLLRHGVEAFGVLVEDLTGWLESHEVASSNEIRGALSLKHCPDPSAFERAHYMKILQGWKVDAGP